MLFRSRQGDDVTLVSYGTEINDVLEASELLESQGIQAEIVKLNQLTPLVPELVEQSVRKTGALVVVEEQGARGWFTDSFPQPGREPSCWSSADFTIREDGAILPPDRG